VHLVDECAVGPAEEEVDVRRTPDGDLQGVRVHERHEEVHPERLRRPRQLLEHGLEHRRRQEEPGVHGVPAGAGDRQGQAGAHGHAAHRGELDREVTAEQRGEATRHAPTLRLW